ncbi:MAG: type II toxin-antitoxin system HicA family toxin [Candidatus Babeliales bacterium]|jgi:hypothetical protein
MNKKQRETLQAIFHEPIRANVKWADIESLLNYLGAEISEGGGSRIRVILNGVKAVFHRPHPRKDTDKGALVSVRRFLENAGIQQ